jgi:aminopeptidase N
MTIATAESSEKIQAWQATTDKLIITFADPIPADKETRISIHYSAQPEKGLYFRTPELGYKPGDEHLFTQGEAVDNRYWFPCPDAPNEKYTTEITCHVPDGMTVLSNGRLLSQEKDPGGLTAFHWSQEKPHANYLVSLVAGFFKGVIDQHKETPLALYVPPSDIGEAENSFRETSDIMDFYEQEIGVPFPWAKYYQVITQDFMEGGMENTTLTTLTENTLFTSAIENLRNSQGLVSHEMAHQWFGDLVTCKDWSHIWLNEGFATYYALLYDGHKNGTDSMLYGFYTTSRRLLQMTNDTGKIVNREFADPDGIFGILPYQKGCFVLRMLRAQLGDDLYRRCIKTYLERHQYGNVATEDLSSVIEELSGRSYDQFFDQWLYHAHFPELAVAYSWDEKAKLAKLSIQQTQALSEDVLLFNFPLKIVFHGKSGSVEKTITVKSQSEDFSFALPEAPAIVRLDPQLEMLAKINFDVPAAMLTAQLHDKTDVIGRLQAVALLKDKKDHASIALLKDAVNHDDFYGVSYEAASALASIHSDESLEALLSSTHQTNARIRLAVISALAAFYNPTARQAEIASLASEKNPDIQAQDLKGLANYPVAEVRDLLLPFLNSQSYRNTLVDAAVSAVRVQDDKSYATPVRQTLERRRDDFTSRTITNCLDTLAFLSRHDTDKGDIRQFLSNYVNDRNIYVRMGALKALGTLGDVAATPILESFANASKETPEQPVATAALHAIYAATNPSDNLQELRATVLQLQKDNRQLRQDLDAIQKKSAPAGKTSAHSKP